MRVSASIQGYHQRILREAIEIEKHPSNVNRDHGFTLSITWKPQLSTLKNGSQDQISMDASRAQEWTDTESMG